MMHRCLWLASALLLLSQACIAQDVPPADAVGEEMMEHVRAAPGVVDAAKERYAEDYASFGRLADDAIDAAYAEQAPAVEASIPAQASPTTAVSDLPADGRGYRLFISQSMPEAELEAAALLAANEPKLVLVFRGMKPDQSLIQLSQLMQRLMRMTVDGPVARIEIDPPAFLAAKVERVPTLIAYHDSEALATARGVIRPEWIERRLNGGSLGDLGAHGSTYPIIEEDLMTLFTQRAAAVAERFDRERAIRSYYDGLTFLDLPAAVIARERRIDPTVIVQQDIITPNGTVIALRGSRINPLDTVPFPGRLLIFDGTSPDQLAIATRELAASAVPVTLITTRLRDDDRGAGLEALHAHFSQRVFLLDERITQRFRVERIPTVVEADTTHYIVREIPAHRTGIDETKE